MPVNEKAVPSRQSGLRHGHGLLGRTVDLVAGAGTLTGRVTAVAFAHGAPTLTIETAEGRTISGLPLGNVSPIRATQ